MFIQHGSFSITRRDRVLFLVMKGAWNLETALAFKQAILDESAVLHGQEWSLVTQMTEWELCTPECEQTIVETAKQAVSRGLTKEALVNSKGMVKLQLFRKYKNQILYFNDVNVFKRQFFTQMQDALHWLQQEGVEVPSQLEN